MEFINNKIVSYSSFSATQLDANNWANDRNSTSTSLIGKPKRARAFLAERQVNSSCFLAAQDTLWNGSCCVVPKIE
jgi:hypothetical protein